MDFGKHSPIRTGSQNLSVKPLGLPAGWTAPQGALDPLGSTITMAGAGEANKFRVLFARSKEGGPRDRLWVSRDGDWAKADVYPSVVKETHYSKATPFGPVRLKLATPDGEVDYHAMIILMDSDPKYANVIVQTSCYYEDRIELEGKTRRVALVDANANGRYGDVGPSLRDCDWLMIDLDGDGSLNAYGPDYKEVFTVGKYLKFGEKLYALSVASNGASPAFRAFEVRAVPSIVLIGPDGRIQQNEVSMGRLEQGVRALVKGGF